MGRYWREWLPERFGDRPALPRGEAVRGFWSERGKRFFPNAGLRAEFDLVVCEKSNVNPP